MRKPHPGLAWLHRFWLRLLLAGLACCLTSQLGLGQAPIIVNRAPALAESPHEVENAHASVLEFEPSGAPLPPIPSVLVFEPVKGPAPKVSSVPHLAPNKPRAAAHSSRPALQPGKVPMPAIPYLLGFRTSTAPSPSQSSSPEFEPSPPPLPPLSSIPVFASPVAFASAHPLSGPSHRAAFGSVIGMHGSKGIDNRRTFLCPIQVEFAEPFVHLESQAKVKDANPLTGNLADTIPPSGSLPQRRE